MLLVSLNVIISSKPLAHSDYDVDMIADKGYRTRPKTYRCGMSGRFSSGDLETQGGETR